MDRAGTTSAAEPDGTGLIAHDPWLRPYAEALRRRYENYRRRRSQIEEAEGSLERFALGHRYFGFNRGQDEGRPGVWYREWAPGARALYLTGEFNGWNRSSHPLKRDEFGVWSIFVPDEPAAGRLRHASRVKVHVVSGAGAMDRIPAYVRRVIYEQNGTRFDGQYWDPPEPYAWRHEPPAPRGAPRIYEAHVGMALTEERIGTFREFTEQVLPRVARAGYNVVQLMAVMEHPYYASFGYQVSSFFAVSSRFGSPEDLKHLIDAAHGQGLRVLLDLVHSHAVKNTYDGLSHFDGTDHQYFHAGPRGQHPAWDSLLFDYGKWETLRFLLSNVRYWLEEFRFDGFRADGVTSMMYLHHGLGWRFGHYDDYLVRGVDEDAIIYLQLANAVAHEVNPGATTVAEDVSGMVGLCRPIDEGGIGFDYRLAMGLPDYWILLLRDRRDEDWSMGEMFGAMANRRAGEKHIGYVECHDQSLVGDKTLAFRLMDADMYWHMNKGSLNPLIERGVALHKMIRLVTFALGGEGWLNFMGNEFGHPEWVDFPREGNGFSYHFARRQWWLVDDPILRYRDLAAADCAILALDERFGLFSEPPGELIDADEARKTLVFRRGRLLFAFNWHTMASYAGYRIGVPETADYEVVLNTDDLFFGGRNIVQTGQMYPRQAAASHGREQSVQVYLPARTAQVLAPLR